MNVSDVSESVERCGMRKFREVYLELNENISLPDLTLFSFFLIYLVNG